MYRLKLIRALADASFNALVLSAMERDAMLVATFQLQSALGDGNFGPEDIIKLANESLPSRVGSDAMRLFFSTQHHIQDGEIDQINDLSRFISARAEPIELKARAELESSTSLGQWTEVLGYLATSYSYVIEASVNLLRHGVVAMRRTAELEAITNRPNESTHYGQAQLFDKAMAIYDQRKEGYKSQLREQFR